jgi:hypothetical protein
MNKIDFSAGTVYPQSMVTEGGNTYFLARLHESGERRLGILGNAAGFSETSEIGAITLCRLTAWNAAALRARLAWLNPVPLGRKTSFGFGDRLGLATPGHVQALRAADPGSRIAPVFAQQSASENRRTGRTAQQVIDDAAWGIFQEGWRLPWGADADQVRELADLEAFIAAGYTFFTVDPGDQVDNAAQTNPADKLRQKTAGFPWDMLQSSAGDMRRRYCREPFVLADLTLVFDEGTLQQVMAKYGQALAHILTMAYELSARMEGRPYDLEISLAGTWSPTSGHEHFFIANELARCAVPVTSIAPRFAGKFQQGVDYSGDRAEFERELSRHAAIMRHFGSYKLSIHAGSDKFSIYPMIARQTGGQVHLKTAGASYLEAVRVAAQNPVLFRRILELARARFEKERDSACLDARLSRIPENGSLADATLPELLDQVDARQVLHVTFGPVLDEFGPGFYDFISQRETDYRAALAAYFSRHLAPFI